MTAIPASGEFSHATQIVRKKVGDTTSAENANASATMADFLVSLDRLQASVPNIESVSLVVAWFGTDLRAGSCKIRPKIEVATKDTGSVSWSVNGVTRSAALVVSYINGKPAFDGTPADFSVYGTTVTFTGSATEWSIPQGSKQFQQFLFARREHRFAPGCGLWRVVHQVEGLA